MTEPKPQRRRLKRHTATGKVERQKQKSSKVRDWEPDADAINIKDVIHASDAMKGNYTGDVGNQRKIPWEDIATQYIEGVLIDPEDPESNRSYPTMRELSEIYKLNVAQIKNRSAKDEWTKKRQQYQIVEAQRRMNNRKFTVLTKSIEFDDNAHKASELGMKLIQVRLGEVAQEVKAKQQIREEALAKMVAGQDYKKSDLYSGVNPREMESLAKAMSAFQEIGMKALGTDVIRHEISGIDTNVFIDQSTHNTQNNVSIQSEMQKDDPERLASILTSLQDASLLPGVVDNILGEVLDGELVDEETTEGTDEEPPGIPLINDEKKTA